MYSSGKLAKSPKLSYWKQAETKEGLYEDLWLLSYEAGKRGWGTFSDAHILADPHFVVLHSANVHFYKPTLTLKPFFTVNEQAQQDAGLETVNEVFESDNPRELLEFDEDDDDMYGVTVSSKLMDDDDEEF